MSCLIYILYLAKYFLKILQLFSACLVCSYNWALNYAFINRFTNGTVAGIVDRGLLKQFNELLR